MHRVSARRLRILEHEKVPNQGLSFVCGLLERVQPPSGVAPFEPFPLHNTVLAKQVEGHSQGQHGACLATSHALVDAVEAHHRAKPHPELLQHSVDETSNRISSPAPACE